MAYTGAAMALGGVVQMLSPQMGGLRMRQGPENKPSYAFGGPVNTTAQGNPSACCTARVKLAGRLSPQAFIPKTSNNHHPFEQTAAIAAFYGRNMAQNMIRGRKGGGGGGHTPVESPDSIQSIARAKMLFALGEGFAGGLDGTNILLTVRRC